MNNITFEHSLITDFITYQVRVSTHLPHSSLTIFYRYRRDGAVLHKPHMLELDTCSRSVRVHLSDKLS